MKNIIVKHLHSSSTLHGALDHLNNLEPAVVVEKEGLSKIVTSSSEANEFFKKAAIVRNFRNKVLSKPCFIS
jgi:hypothetical protein